MINIKGLRLTSNEPSQRFFKKKTSNIARSFYLSEDIIKDLEIAAKKTGVSLNALVNKTLRDSALHAYSTKEYGSTIVSNGLLVELLKESREEVVTSWARDNGKKVFRDAIITGGRPRNLETFRYFVKDGYCNYSNWAEYYEHFTDDALILKLNHHLGPLWSKFMKEYFYAGLCEIIGSNIAPPEAFSIADNGLIIVIPLELFRS
ncbi:MAG: hypothetical protein LUP94_02625 [Candidatus Methanomethylicus sp.]|nr:hypothetical protein [Candidatus Methanomethylicus sp.]